ncbi:hypothetical protein Tco_1281707 [Tanacetum coccineum]
MMTTRKRVGPLLTPRLALRHSVDYSSSDHFTSDDSSRDSSSSSSSETSSDSSSDALSGSSSSYSSSDHPSSTLSSGMRSSHQLCSLVPSIHYSSTAITERPSHTSFVGPSRKRSGSPTTSVPVSSPIHGALSSVRAHLSRGTDLEMDVDVERSDEPHSEPEIDPVEMVIEACFDFTDIIRGSRIDVRVEAVTVMCGSRTTST